MEAGDSSSGESRVVPGAKRICWLIEITMAGMNGVIQCGYRHDRIDMVKVRLQAKVGKRIAENVPLHFKT